MKRLWILGLAFTILGSGILFVGLGISKDSKDDFYYGVTINGEKIKSVESSYDVSSGDVRLEQMQIANTSILW